MTKTEHLLYATVKLMSIALLQYCINSSKDSVIHKAISEEIRALLARLDIRLEED